MKKDNKNGIDKEENIDDTKELDEELELSENVEEDQSSDEEEIENLQDQLLRAKAEVQNIRRISEQEIRKARLYGIENLAKNFLSVGDNLERALESLNEDSKLEELREGLDLIYKTFEDSLETGGVIPINPNGELFDPEKHEALSVIENDELDPNTVIEVIQRGFMIQDRVLRPAKVIVSKKS
ncbi:MAG: nucleotide exchange factor GrpE [Gammaproteobacteria bacterium]